MGTDGSRTSVPATPDSDRQTLGMDHRLKIYDLSVLEFVKKITTSAPSYKNLAPFGDSGSCIIPHPVYKELPAMGHWGRCTLDFQPFNFFRVTLVPQKLLNPFSYDL